MGMPVRAVLIRLRRRGEESVFHGHRHADSVVDPRGSIDFEAGSSKHFECKQAIFGVLLLRDHREEHLQFTHREDAGCQDAVLIRTQLGHTYKIGVLQGGERPVT